MKQSADKVSASDDRNSKILEIMYSDISNHLRATDEKRDRLVNLYFTLTTAAMAAIAAVMATNTIGLNICVRLSALVSLFLFLLGYLILESEASSRKWHAEYMNCMIIIQKLMVRESVRFDSALVPEAQREQFAVPPHSSRSFLPTSAIMLSAGTLSAVCFFENSWVWVATSVLPAIILQALNIERLNSWLARCQMEFWRKPENCWCLSFLER